MGGCDSIVVTEIILGQSQQNTQNFTIDPGDSVVVNGVSYTSDTTFTEVFTNMDNCDSTMTTSVTVRDTTSGPGAISGQLSEHIRIVPNPSNGLYHIDLSSIRSKSAEIMVVDNLGQVVKKNIQLNAGNTDLDLRDLDNGVYFLVVRTEDDSATIKLIKQE